MKVNPGILLVEDSRPQALHMAGLLQGAGWEVTIAASAERAMESLETVTPDLILVDYYLPGIRGDDLCRRMRKRVDTRATPIVILTSDAAHEVELRGLDSGADDFITKGADHDVLLIRLRALLARTAADDRPPPACAASFEGATILAVDDSQTYRIYLAAQLEAEGYRVETVGSGADVLQRLATAEFDCVLVDLVMPGMNGIEVCRQINQLRVRDHKSVMVLMLTAKEDNECLADALDAGADDFVGKSSDIVVIKGRIRALLRRKAYEDEHHRRLRAELMARELEALHARAEKEAAEARAALVDDLERTAEALRRSNEDLQQFANVASHDLQEPLRQVASYIQLIERRHGAAFDEQARELMKYVVEGVRRMKTLISDLLEYSRAAERPDALASESTFTADCEAALGDAVRNLAAAIESSGASVTHDPLPSAPLHAAPLTHVLQNLIANALKYRGSAPPHVHVSVSEEAGQWVLSVRDNGIGIEPQYWDRIFVMFQRLHDRQEYPGNGVGLAICKKIVQRFGGRIWVESTPGQGSTFSFSLPIKENGGHARAIRSQA